MGSKRLGGASRPPRTCVALLALAGAVTAQNATDASPSVSIYEMEVELRPVAKSVSGRQRITWRNTTRGATSELWIHLYLNAFRDLDSTFMKESDAAFREQWRADEFGSCQLLSLQLETGAGAIHLNPTPVQPDDDNPRDATVVVAQLPSPVAPGESITLETTFVSRLPKAYCRTGWVPDDGFFCMQWYPKLGVLEDVNGGESRWTCHQFHRSTEFFADYSQYDVRITTPSRFVIGATGGRPIEQRDQDGLTTWRFRQDDVHDFAFVAGDDFVVHEHTFGPIEAKHDPVARAVAKRMGVPVETFDIDKETRIRLMLNPEHDTVEQVDRHISAIQCALEFYGLRFGPYPYDAITLVDPARDMDGRRLGGGMEYPTLITCGTSLWPHPRKPQPEGVTVHEFGHQYFYGLVASNELEESWLDEGITTYTAGRAQWLRYHDTMRPVRTTELGLVTVAGASFAVDPVEGVLGYGTLPVRDWVPDRIDSVFDALSFEGTVVPQSVLLEFLATQPTATACREASFSGRFHDRRRWLDVDNPDAMVRAGWEFASHASYVANSHQRPATLLRTMEAMVGRDAWWTFMRKYFARSRFGHPTTADFVALLGEECGAGPAEFFRLAIEAEAEFDYGVRDVVPRDGRGPVKTVTVQRYGGMRGDVQVRFRFRGRAEPVYRTFAASEEYPWKRFRFDDREESWGDLIEVWVDPPVDPAAHEAAFGPCGAYLIDSNLLNNAWRPDVDRAPAFYRALRALLQTQNQLTFTGIAG